MRMISGYSWRKPKGTDTCAWCGVLIEVSQDTGSRELIDSYLVGVGMEGAAASSGIASFVCGRSGISSLSLLMKIQRTTALSVK